jgi:hypothetical protein
MSGRLFHLEAVFRNLLTVGYVPKSDASESYNCVAYAAGDEHRIWVGYRCAGYWPPGAKEGRDISALVDAFEKIGYSACGMDDSLDPDSDKVVLYWDSRDWTHVARQWPDGRWTSKIGDYEDIIHNSPYAVVGPGRDYGSIYGYMKRPKPS